MAGTLIQTCEPSSVEMAGQHNGEIDPQHMSEGLLLSEEQTLTYHEAIVDVEDLGHDTRNGHQVHLERLTMLDGNIYEVESVDPAIAASDTAIVTTSPWLTRRQGFNTAVTNQFNELGYPTLGVYPIGKSVKANLRDSVHNMNYIVQRAIDQNDWRPVVLAAGGSRAAAIVQALDNLQYAELLARCFSRSPSTLKEWIEAAGQLPVEVLEVVKYAGRLSVQDKVKQAKTFSPYPRDWIYSLGAIPTLTNGDAGRLGEINRDVPMVITRFRKDRWDDTEIDRPNTKTYVVDGRHINLADAQAQEATLLRYAALAEVRGFDGDFSQVDFQAIMDIHPRPQEKAGRLGRFSVRKVAQAAYEFATTS